MAKKRKIEELLELIHEEVAETFLDFVRANKELMARKFEEVEESEDGKVTKKEVKYPASMYNTIRSFLKDNNVEKLKVAPNDPLGLLGEEMPEFDDDFPLPN